MSETRRGKLVVQESPEGPRLRLIEQGKTKAKTVGPQELHPDLRALWREARGDLDGRNVDYRSGGGQIKQVRPVGAPEFAYGAPAPEGRPDERPAALPLGHGFHNPYNFVPAPARGDAGGGPLADGPPLGHDHLAEAAWTGVLHVELAAETPLVLVDAARAREDPRTEHKTFPVRCLLDGSPDLPPTAVKGMLRSAFEAITNSRFGVWSSRHDQRLAFRQVTVDGLRAVPARVVEGGTKVELHLGTSRWQPRGPQGPVYAAWWPRYLHAVEPIGGEPLRNGDPCEAWLEKFDHDAPRGGSFGLWRVRQIAPPGGLPPRPPAPTTETTGRYRPVGERLLRVSGWVCVTGHAIPNKHDERVFFSTGPPQVLEIEQSHARAWNEILDAYVRAHEGERRPSPGPDYSRQVLDERARRKAHPDQDDAERLVEPIPDGTMCYARLDSSGGKVERLYPVMIGRELYDRAPSELVAGAGLLPAEAISQLSPAERVFGWVAGRKVPLSRGQVRAHRGQVRIGPATCPEGAAAVERFPSAVPLAVLGEPKPQQARFYGARSQKGEPYAAGVRKQEMYRPDHGIRGRKMYLHHTGLPKDWWAIPADGSASREYLHPRRGRPEAKTNQNRSIDGWVKPGSRFRFDVHVHNLSSVELGALVWLLDLSQQVPGAFLKLGGAKPLGFGSVSARVTGAELGTGAAWREAYRSLAEPSFDDSWRSTIDEFQAEVGRVYGSGNFEGAPFVAAFLAMAKGPQDGLPVHSARSQPEPETESYRWFVANERIRGGQAAGLALPPAAADPGLPYEPEAQGGGGQQHRPPPSPRPQTGRGRR